MRRGAGCGVPCGVGRSVGIVVTMAGTPDTTPDAGADVAPADVAPADVRPSEEQVAHRAALLPEERAVGSDDPEGQAEAVLTDSAVRTEVPDAAPTTHLERRRSDEAL